MTTVGTGKHTYTLTSDWARMPAAHPMGAVSALASDSAGDIYIFHRADPPIAIFDRSGNFKSGWGNGSFVYAHGFYIEGDIVYLTDRDTSVCIMYTLDGKPIQMLGATASIRTPALRWPVSWCRGPPARSTIPPRWCPRPAATCSSPTATATPACTVLITMAT